MLTFTDAARDRVVALLQDFGSDGALRVALLDGSSPLAPEFELDLVESSDHEGDDVAFDAGGFPVFVDAASAPRLEGAVVDFSGGTFEIALPPGAAIAGGELAARVAEAIERRVNPGIAAHGGHITLVGVRDNVAYVRMSGGCQGCGLAAVTLRQGVERMVRAAVPEIEAVRDVTDHEHGANPFYARR